MLKIILGKARAGKTAAIIDEIKKSAQNKVGNQILLVPDQYSHEAERELAESCGDTISLYAEVMTFNQLGIMVSNKVGGNSNTYLDDAGRLLCMAVALEKSSPCLRIFSSSIRKLDTHEMILSAIDEMKLSQISPEMLSNASKSFDGTLGEKLNELSVICSAYDSVVSMGHSDPSDAIKHLTEQIFLLDFSSYHFYVDGFTDFTNAEIDVFKALLSRNADITICMTVDSLLENSGVFSPARNSIKKLIVQTDAIGVKADVTMFPQRISSFADDVFEFSDNKPNINVELFTCNSMEDECELAASKILELVREKKCRYRDISIAVRGFEDYCATLKSILKQYGIPLFVAQRSPISGKPLAALIQYSYNIILNGWRPDDIISYLGTGLIDVSFEDRDLLTSYLQRWDIREGLWYSSNTWHFHPDGYDGDFTEATEKILSKINHIRANLFTPLSAFQSAATKAATASEQVKALSDFLKSINISKMLEIRSEKLRESGSISTAEEYIQLWEITVNALEQIYSILGDSEICALDFSKLFMLLLSKYDVGIIPISLDMVNAGDFVKMRKRNIKHLIILGADANRIPKANEDLKIFTSDEIKSLRSKGIDFRFADEGEMWREFSLIYNCLSLPKESLIMSCVQGDSGKSFVMTRAEQLCKFSAIPFDIERARLNSRFSALILAASSSSSNAHTAKEYFKETEDNTLEKILMASKLKREHLSPESVKSLYGDSLHLSASRTDSFYSCKYAYFCQYGLKVKQFEPAKFSFKTMGNFTHYVLENLFRELKESGDLKSASQKTIRNLTDKYIAIYVHDELNNFEDKNERFRYLFNRFCESLHRIIQETLKEIQNSKFEPETFELSFDNDEKYAPLSLNDSGDELRLSGIADRIDIWDNNGTKYLRVIDYKTGSKKFSLSDIWYGLSMQMLMYLYELEHESNSSITPAGIMYIPEREKYYSFNDNPSDEDIEKEKSKYTVRTGLMLDVDGMEEAWGVINTKLGKMSPEQYSNLCIHMNKKLSDMVADIHNGSIEANPYRKDSSSCACDYCPYKKSCGFIDGENGEHEQLIKKLSEDEVWSLLQGENEND